MHPPMVKDAKAANEFRIGPLVGIPGLLLELGCNPDPIFRRANFDRAILDDTENRTTYQRGSRLLAECVAASGCECFGLLLGMRANPSHLGLAGFLVRAAPTAGKALETLVENFDLHDQGGDLILEVGEEHTQLTFQVHVPDIPATEQIYDLSAVMMYNIMRLLCGENWSASKVQLERRQPRDLTPYKQFFKTWLVFDSERCGIIFPNHCLNLKSPSSDQLLFRHLEQAAQLLHRAMTGEFVDSVPAALRQGLLTGRYSAPDLAHSFGVQVRTLHRRLRSAGTSFRHELDGARELISRQLLENTTLAICDIATSLGYSDSSGFIRAFRRWTGTSPAAWRKRNRMH